MGWCAMLTGSPAAVCTRRCLLGRRGPAQVIAALSGHRHITDVASAAQLAELSKSKDAKQRALLFFTAAWAEPCREVAPHVEELSRRLGSRCEVFRIDVAEHSQVAR